MTDKTNDFAEFEAIVPENFAALMVDYWEADENLTRDQVIATYYNESFKALCKRIAGTKCRFKPDFGYGSDIDGTLCFEVEDDNFVIPVNILEVL